MAAPIFPRMFGKYALLRPFARGGMGEICLAAHGDLGGLEKLCLVKRVLEADDQPSLQARLLDEAKVAVRLNHANLVQVFDAGKVDEELYIAMELIAGRDLRAVWNRTAERRARIPLDVALFVVREMARGLEYAHNYGDLHLVHRDIAPPNILLSWHGEVKITDFGLARSTLKSEKTAPGIVYGRIAYLAPEQARGEQADNRTDLYAVGVILWELLTGRPLHETTDEAVKNLEMARHPRIEPPSHFARSVAPSLDAVVMKALALRREDRFQTSEELRRGLSEELGRIAPTTDASRLASWLSELFESEVKSEALDNERLLREELPRLRQRNTFQVPALPASPLNVVKAQSLDLRIAGVDRESDAFADDPTGNQTPTTAPPKGRPLPGMGPSTTSAGPAGKVPPIAPSKAGRPLPPKRAAGPSFDDDGETRVKAPRSPLTESGHLGIALAPARKPPPPTEVDDTLAAEDLIGEIIDSRYRIERLLGTGGMGAVYEAEHVDIGKKVALKVLHPQFSRQADLVARFRREARAASKVGHPNIVDVTDSGTTESGEVYFVMEHLDGTDLGDVLRQERRIAVDRTLAIGTQICRALQAAHTAGIIHRDLKPENIFLVAREGQPDFVKVLDFGIAKSDGGTQPPRRLTTPGIAMGTPEYMAPEQAAGKPIDGRVDIYSVGAILYEMLSGEPPHAGTSVMDILAKKATQPPEPLRTRAKSVSEQLERVVMSCLERDPAGRPQTMAVLEYELTKCGKGRGSAVAAVLGINAKTDGGWGDDPSRTGNFDGFAGPTTVTGPRIGEPDAARTVNGKAPRLDDPDESVEGLADLIDPSVPIELLERPGVLDAPPARSPSLVEGPAVVASPGGWSRVLGLLGGLAFLGAGGYFAYTYQQGRKAPTRASKPGSAGPTDPAVERNGPSDPNPNAGVTELPGAATVPSGKPVPAEPTPADEQLSDAEILRLLEWARRTAEGGRIVAPPGDNLKELLDRIEKANPGNAGAADLRKKTSSLLGRRGALALKKLRLEEAEDAFRALVVLNPEDEYARGRLARTLAVRADRSLERRRYQAAVTDANQALELQPDDVLARMVLAEAHLATGKREIAAEEFKRVLELRPADKRAKHGLAASMAPAPKRGKPAAKKKR